MAKFLTLEEWSSETYEGKQPTLQTLQRWARNGNIYPAPEKHGREYRVRPDACYISTCKVGAKALKNPRHTTTNSPLMEKLINDAAKHEI